jgi:hypothetical protein
LHYLTENRHGLIVDVEVTEAMGGRSGMQRP